MNSGLRRLRKPRFFMALTSLALVAGTIIGWSTVFAEVDRYCTAQGSGLLSLIAWQTGSVKNPLLAPCFWGSIVFVITLAWSLYLLLDKKLQARGSSVRKLSWLLLAGTIFAFVNNAPIFYNFYTKPKGTAVGCSAESITSPFITGCFGGFSAFLAAWLFSWAAVWSIRALAKK